MHQDFENKTFVLKTRLSIAVQLFEYKIFYGGTEDEYCVWDSECCEERRPGGG